MFSQLRWNFWVSEESLEQVALQFELLSQLTALVVVDVAVLSADLHCYQMCFSSNVSVEEVERNVNGFFGLWIIVNGPSSFLSFFLGPFSAGTCSIAKNKNKKEKMKMTMRTKIKDEMSVKNKKFTEK